MLRPRSIVVCSIRCDHPCFLAHMMNRFCVNCGIVSPLSLWLRSSPTSPIVASIHTRGAHSTKAQTVGRVGGDRSVPCAVSPNLRECTALCPSLSLEVLVLPLPREKSLRTRSLLLPSSGCSFRFSSHASCLSVCPSNLTILYHIAHPLSIPVPCNLKNYLLPCKHAPPHATV